MHLVMECRTLERITSQKTEVGWPFFTTDKLRVKDAKDGVLWRLQIRLLPLYPPHSPEGRL